LILLDVMMPEMDGYSLLSEIRKQPNLRDIPVIFVTALSDEANEEHGFELGAVDYIAKPISPAIVLARVSAHIELKDARDRLQDQNTWLEAEVQHRVHENDLIQIRTGRGEYVFIPLTPLRISRHPETYCKAGPVPP